MAVDSLAKATIHEPVGAPGGPGLWHHKTWQLPAYIQHIANDLREKRGMDESRAISTAIATVKRWATGGGNVDATTRAAADKAVAEWEALKAKAAAVRTKALSEPEVPQGIVNLAEEFIALDEEEGGVDLAQPDTNIGKLNVAKKAVLDYLKVETDQDDQQEGRSILARIVALISKDQADLATGQKGRPSYFSADDDSEGLFLLAEMYLDGGAQTEEDGMIWKPVLREGKWKLSPGPGQAPQNKPITVIKDGKSNPEKLIISMSEILKNFKDGAIEHVTIPVSHDNKVTDNTGFIRDLRLAKDKEGRWVLEAAHDFTEPDIKGKAQRGTIANTSAGVLFDYPRKEDAKKFNAVLEHVALTNRPWLSGMKPFGMAADNKEVTVMSFSEDGTFSDEELEALMKEEEVKTPPTAALAETVENADAAAASEADVNLGGGFSPIQKCNTGGQDGYKGHDGTCYTYAADGSDKKAALMKAMKSHGTNMSDDELIEAIDLAVGTTPTGKTPTKPYGDVKYGDPGYQKDGKPRYPLDTEGHIRAGWAYINKAANAAAYSAGQLKKVKSRIRSALKGTGAAVNMSDELLTQENERALRALIDRKEDIVAENDTVDTNAAFVESFGLSEEEIRDALAERDRLMLGDRARRVEDKIKAWEGEKKSPAVLKVAEEFLLADPGTTALNLSEGQDDEGKYGGAPAKTRSLTLSEVIEALVNASPEVLLEEKKATEKTATEGNAPPETDEEVELSDEVQAEARRLYLYEGATQEEAIAKATAKFGSTEEVK